MRKYIAAAAAALTLVLGLPVAASAASSDGTQVLRTQGCAGDPATGQVCTDAIVMVQRVTTPSGDMMLFVEGHGTSTNIRPGADPVISEFRVTEHTIYRAGTFSGYVYVDLATTTVGTLSCSFSSLLHYADGVWQLTRFEYTCTPPV